MNKILESLAAEIDNPKLITSENRAEIIQQLIRPAAQALRQKDEELEIVYEDLDELRTRVTHMQAQLDSSIAGLRKIRRSMGEED